MGYNFELGMVCTTDGSLYACDWATHHTMIVLTKSLYPVQDMECELQHVEDSVTLVMQVKNSHAVKIWGIRLKCIMPQLTRIQNAVRDWLHKRQAPTRQEAALCLRTKLTKDLVALIFETFLH